MNNNKINKITLFVGYFFCEKIIKFIMMNLCACKLGKIYKIEKIVLDDKGILFELQNFLILEGSEIKVLKSNYGKKSYLIELNGICYAIDKKIAEKIFVCEEKI